MREKLIYLWDNMDRIISGTLLCLIILLLFVQVIARYFLGFSIAWADELSRFMLLGLVYISTSVGIKQGAHIRLNAHLQFLPKSVKQALNIISDMIWIIFNIVVIYEGCSLIESMGKKPLISGALMLDMRYVFVIIPLGFLLQTLRIFENWVKAIRSYRAQVKERNA